MTRSGKVYLVGAGPGHPELLTIKAAELIKTADAIVYDRLIQQEVLALARPDAERIYMGKPVGRHESRQDEANELLVRLAWSGKMVVRLKGGDPFVFGRGGEEAEYLAEHGVPFEVVPGVCAAMSAPLAAGIPVTHRDFSSSVAIVTGHNADGNGHRVNWDALAHIDTVVFLMGVHNAAHIAENLIVHGRSPDTPAAVVQMAFWHDERVICGTLRTLPELIRKSEIKPPATLVVGDVVRLHDKLQSAQRDLKRRPDDALGFQPGPSPDQLLRMASGGMEAQLLGWALDIRLFDHLEQSISAYDLAQRFALQAEAVSDLLDTLVTLRLLESRPEGYCNLELASRYLTAGSSQGLRDLLLYNCSRITNWESLGEFARKGRLTPSPADGQLHLDACEATARFMAPTVVEAIASEVAPRTALVIGWAARAHCDALLRRWPNLQVHTCNPLAGDAMPGVMPDLLILSGILEGIDVTRLEAIMEHVGSLAGERTQIVVRDTVMALGSRPSPELALSMLARRIADGGYRSWTAERLCALLEAHCLRVVRTETAVAGQMIVFAAKGKLKAMAASGQ